MLIVCVFMPQVDYFIVNVALPTIDRSLHASSGALELVVAGYGAASLPCWSSVAAWGTWSAGAGCSRSGLPDSPWRHLDAVRAERVVFARCPSGAGRLCGHDRPPGARDVPRHPSRRQAAPSAKPVRRCRRTGYHHRPARRRTVRHRQHRWDHMATDLLGQRPHRPRYTQRRPAVRTRHSLAACCHHRPSWDPAVRSHAHHCPRAPRRRPIKWVADVDLGRSQVRPHRRLPHDPC